jgi:hypothetical protein
MTLKIAWLDINIKFKNDVKLNGVNVDGYFSPREKEILIDDELPKHMKQKVLLHELVHAMLFAFGRYDYDDENLVDTIASGIITLLKDNKEEVIKVMSDI